jgi:hypothetical protein
VYVHVYVCVCVLVCMSGHVCVRFMHARLSSCLISGCEYDAIRVVGFHQI